MNTNGQDVPLRGVEIFVAGKHKGKDYTTKDLDDIVRNFNEHSTGDDPLVSVPAAVGHEEEGEQPLLENTGIPRLGRPVRVWREGDLVKADFADIPPLIRKLLKKKAYTHVSSEIYDKPPEGVPGSGKMLRRVCFLGGELPHIKTLADLPPLYEDFGETVAGHKGRLRIVGVKPSKTRGAYMVFSEVSAMSRDELIEALKAKGMPDDVLATMDDLQLQAVYDSHQSPEGEVAATEEGEGGDQIAGYSEGDPMDPKQKEEEDAKLLQAKDPEEQPADADFADVPEGEEGKDYLLDKVKKFYEHACKTYGEDQIPYTLVDKQAAKPGEPATAGGFSQDKQTQPMAFSEKQVNAIVAKVTSQVAAKVLAGVSPIKQSVVKFAEETRRKEIGAFLDRMVEDGRVEPWERDPSSGLPTLDESLCELAKSSKVYKFGEKSLTELDVFKMRLEQRPMVNRRNIRTSLPGSAFKTFSEASTPQAKLERFSETNPDVVQEMGFTPAEVAAIAKRCSTEEAERWLHEMTTRVNTGA